MTKNAMFEERKANVSETAKEIVSHALRTIDLEDYAREYAQNKYCSEQNKTPNYKIAQIHAGRDGFINGAIFMRNSVWHTDKEPFIEREGKQMIVLVYRDGELIFSTIKYAKEFNCFYNQNKLSYDLFRYAYIEDLIPVDWEIVRGILC